MNIEKIIFTPNAPGGEGARPLRVAAYCRVSTDTDEQRTSFENQVKTYTDMIEREPGWKLAGIYADEGLTGTSVAKRRQFLKMIADCEAGKVDLIVTKSISRFARNTLECLTYVRHLNQIGVHLIFENNHIDTRTAFSEMLLTVLAAFAQEESRSIALNTTWGIRKRYEEGRARWAKLYGYERDQDGGYLIVPEQAAIVREIFTLYEHGVSIARIMRHLQEKGVPTPENCEKWSMCTVRIMLMNERYCGDILLQKSICESHITHKAIKNDATQVPSYYIEDHHPAIISRAQFRRCKQILAMRRTPHPDMPELYHDQYPLGDKLVCPICGSRLFKRSMRIQRTGSGWCCEIGEHACRQFIIRTSFVEAALLQAYHILDVDSVAMKRDSPRFGAAAETMLRCKRDHPRMKKVEFWWVDDLVDHIEFGLHSRTTKELAALRADGATDADDRTMKVYWRCGLVTTVPSGICHDPDLPGRVAKLYQDYQIRHPETQKTRKRKGRSKK